MNFWHQFFEPMSQLVNSIPGFQLTNLKFFKYRFVETIPAARSLQNSISLDEFKILKTLPKVLKSNWFSSRRESPAH